MSEPAELMIRLARPDERDGLEALQRRASLALGEYNEQLEAEQDAVQLPLEQVERGDVIVAELDDRLVGFAAVVIEDDAAELGGLFVEPELWRKGIGSALVDVAVHEARRPRPGDDGRRQPLGAPILREMRLHVRGQRGYQVRTGTQDVALAAFIFPMPLLALR